MPKALLPSGYRKDQAMEFVDLSRELFHRTPVHPSHPPVIITVWDDHDKKVTAGNTTFSSKALSVSFSDQCGTHVDAPAHFDPRPGAKSIDEVPLENFYTSAFRLDLSHVPLKHAITVKEMEEALKKSGQEIKPKDTVLIYMGTNDRLYGDPRYAHDFPGLALESVHWLANKGIGMFGVEAVSPSPEGELNFRALRGITHMECLFNLEKLVGRGRFRFVGFPPKIRGGSGSPIRAVAIFE
jgi:kynurenine formamidase